MSETSSQKKKFGSCIAISLLTIVFLLVIESVTLYHIYAIIKFYWEGLVLYIAYIFVIFDFMYYYLVITINRNVANCFLISAH